MQFLSLHSTAARGQLRCSLAFLLISPPNSGKTSNSITCKVFVMVKGNTDENTRYVKVSVHSPHSCQFIPNHSHPQSPSLTLFVGLRTRCNCQPMMNPPPAGARGLDTGRPSGPLTNHSSPGTCANALLTAAASATSSALFSDCCSAAKAASMWGCALRRKGRMN